MYKHNQTNRRQIQIAFAKVNISNAMVKKDLCPRTLTYLFPMHPFSTSWKHKKTIRFSDVFRGRERVHWEKMG